MELIEAMQKRKSIRGFKKDLVHFATIKEILDIALRAPSASNIQPWEVVVVTGEPLNKIKDANVKKNLENGGNSSVKHDEVYQKRKVALAKQLFGLLGIKREDKGKRAEWMKQGLRFFDAPVGLIIHMDKSLEGTKALFDIGCLAQSICLIALGYGLGTCIEEQGVAFEDVLRNYTGLPSTKKPVIGIAMGYPDWNHPANQIVSERERLDTITSWVGF